MFIAYDIQKDTLEANIYQYVHQGNGHSRTLDEILAKFGFNRALTRRTLRYLVMDKYLLRAEIRPDAEILFHA